MRTPTNTQTHTKSMCVCFTVRVITPCRQPHRHWSPTKNFPMTLTCHHHNLRPSLRVTHTCERNLKQEEDENLFRIFILIISCSCTTIRSLRSYSDQIRPSSKESDWIRLRQAETDGTRRNMFQSLGFNGGCFWGRGEGLHFSRFTHFVERVWT